MTDDQIALIVCWACVLGTVASVAGAPEPGRRQGWRVGVAALASAVMLRVALPWGVIDPYGHGLERTVPIQEHGALGALGGEVVHGAAAAAWERMTVLPSFGWIDPWTSSTLLLALAAGLFATAPSGEAKDKKASVFLALALLPPLLRLAPTATLVLAAAAGWIATDAMARRFIHHGGLRAWLGVLCVSVWTMQTHLELLVGIPALVTLRLLLDGRPALRALGPVRVLTSTALAGIALLPALSHAAAMRSPGGHTSMLAAIGDPARRPVIGLFGLLTGASLVIAALRSPEGGTTPARTAKHLAAAGVGITCVLGLAFDVWHHPTEAIAWPEASVLLHRGFFPWTSAAVIALGWLTEARSARGPFRVWADTGLIAGLLTLYAGSADNFSTWLREGAIPAAMLYPWAVRGLGHLPRPVAISAVLATLVLSRGALWTPIDSQQDSALAGAVHALRGDGVRVHGLTSTDDEGFADPSRVDLERRRRAHDLVLDPRLEDLREVSLTNLLEAGPQATGRAVLLDAACFRATATDPAIDAEAIVVDGPRAVAQGLQRPHLWERWRRVRPDGAANMLLQTPCLGQPAAQTCLTPEADGTCRTYTCLPDATASPDGWQNALCAKVRASFSLIAIVEEPLAPWTVDAAWAAPLARGVSVGLYRVTGVQQATSEVETTEPTR